MSIKAEIVADSINPRGNRLTSFVLEYPRFIHAEVMTHRVFSKNAASSRAIPIDKMIQQVIDNPAMPVWWGKNQSGMQAKEELDNTIRRGWCEPHPTNEWAHLDCEGTDLEHAKRIWLQARDQAIDFVKQLNRLGLHKQVANRILEPWFNIRIIFSGTEFENFFALRAHPDAQPEFQTLANTMLELYNKSEPKKMAFGEWHIPFGDKIEESKLEYMPSVWEETESLKKQGFEYYCEAEPMAKQEIKKKIAIARCARVSYLNFEGKDDYEADVKLCNRLFGQNPKHLSPTEHVAQSQDNSDFIGNFRGWKQFRKFFDDENLKDNRVIKKNGLTMV